MINHLGKRIDSFEGLQHQIYKKHKNNDEAVHLSARARERVAQGGGSLPHQEKIVSETQTFEVECSARHRFAVTLLELESSEQFCALCGDAPLSRAQLPHAERSLRTEGASEVQQQSRKRRSSPWQEHEQYAHRAENEFPATQKKLEKKISKEYFEDLKDQQSDEYGKRQQQLLEEAQVAGTAQSSASNSSDTQSSEKHDAEHPSRGPNKIQEAYEEV